MHNYYLISTFLLCSCFGVSANAGLLGTANNYNVFTLSNFTQSGTDSLGRVAVGGKFDPGGTINSSYLDGSGSYSVASNQPNNPSIDNLVVGGDYRNGSTTINGNVGIQGNASVEGTVTGTLKVGGDLTRGYGTQGSNVLAGGNINYTGPSGSLNITSVGNLSIGGGGYLNGNIYYGGTFTNHDSYIPFSGTSNHVTLPAPVLPINFVSESSFLKTLSGKLDALGTTGNVNFTGNTSNHMLGALILTGTNTQQDIYHITGAMLSNTNSFTITGKAQETVVINVDGPLASMSNFGFTLNNVDRQHILFNFYNGGNATTLTSNGVGIQSSVLAPFTDINFAGGNIDGTIIGRTIRGGGESHEFLFQGNVQFPDSTIATPEPATVVSASLGLLGVAAFAFRRRRTA